MDKNTVQPSQVLNEILALTFTRHARLSSDDFLKEIKAPEGVTEQEWTRKVLFTLLSAVTKEVLRANEKITIIDQTIQVATKE